jgi:hypothetical protein
VLSRTQCTAAAGTGGEDISAAIAAWRKRATGVLRFPVGAPVECLVADGEWVTGKVAKHNYREPGVGLMPYQVLVTDTEHVRGDRNAVWAPADIDACIRSGLRFRIGETVQCCVNPDLALWAHGEIVAHFYRESGWPESKFAPYQIRIESFFDETTGKTHHGALIWAPEDSDACVRKERVGGLPTFFQ